MGEFDATIAAAGYRDTEITQEHASQKNSGGSQLSRDQNNKRENTWEQRKSRVGWVPVKPGPKQKERAHVSRERRGCCGSQLRRDKNKKKEHMRAEKEEGVVVPSWAGTQTLQTRTHEMQ